MKWWSSLASWKQDMIGAFVGVIGAVAICALLLFVTARAWAAPAVTAVSAPVAKPAPKPERIVIPEHSARYRMAIEREAGAVFGLDASPARIAAQIHQESRFKASAESPYAQGLAQFTPSTAAWMAKVFPRECSEADPWDEQWAIRCAVRYDEYLYQRSSGATTCDRWAFTLSAYNGGLGWVNRDRRKASGEGLDSERWFKNVELHSARASWARAENRGYVRRILGLLEHVYIDAGWPGAAVCARGV